MFFSVKQVGFSLIELMVAVALFSILASFAIPSYQQMIENTKIRTAAESIQAGLQLARSEAVSRNARVQFDFRAGPAWSVCTSPAGGGSCPSVNNATTIQSRSAGEGAGTNLTITEANAGPYVFNGFGILISPAAGGQVAITNNALAGSRDLTVQIGLGGTIKTCDPALSSTGNDPRRC